MKHIILFTLMTLAGFLLKSCSEDTATDVEYNYGERGDIRFTATFGSTRVETGADFISEWEDGDAIGVFAVKHPSGESAALSASGNYIHNVKVVYRSNNGGEWVPDEALYYAAEGYELDFYAYHPYDASATDPTNIQFSVMADQNGDTGGRSNYNLSDFMSASVNDVVKDETVELAFLRRTALMQLEVPAGEMTGSGPNETLVVRLKDFATDFTLNLSAGTATTTAGSKTDITMFRYEKPDDENYATSYTFRALVPAQTVASEARIFEMEQDGNLFGSTKLASAFEVTAGKALRHEIPLPFTIHTVSVSAGTFLMGSTNTTDEPSRLTNETQHSVTLTRNFKMSRYLITNAQFCLFLNDVGINHLGKYNTTSGYGEQIIVKEATSQKWGVTYNSIDLKWEPVSGYDNHPVIWVTWYGALEFAKWAGGGLPTEAQWEYACRAGNTTPFGIGNGRKLTGEMANIYGTFEYDLDKGSGAHYKNDNGINLAATTPVGSYAPNNWGLYDMHGNVAEWCMDYYLSTYYTADPVTDPEGPETGTHRATRGGSFESYASECRSAKRASMNPVSPNYRTGFRVIFE